MNSYPLLDWVLCLKLGFGAPGLILATTAVNALSVLILFQVLGVKVRRAGAAFQWTLLAEASAKLLLCTGVGVLVAAAAYYATSSGLTLDEALSSVQAVGGAATQMADAAPMSM